MKHYDVIVVGLGAMGSAALYQLSKKTTNVLGIDMYDPPHSFGSSFGGTRMTRTANGEGEAYTKLALRANEIWKELEAVTGASLLHQNGGLIIREETSEEESFHGKSDFFGRTVEMAKKYNIRHDILNASDIHARFPQFTLTGTETAYYEYDAGYLAVEACLDTQLGLAKKQGATVHTYEKVESVVPSGDGAIVTTNKATYTADKVVVSPGPWIASLLGDEYKDIFKVYRQVTHWWDIDDNRSSFLPQDFPVSIMLRGAETCYAFPAVDGSAGGVRMGFDNLESPTDPDVIDRSISQNDVQMAYEMCVSRYFSDVSSRCLRSSVCMLTFTSDANFIVDTLPDHPQIVVASPCSGGGFKHSAAIGEILAELSLTGKAFMPIEEFSLKRFGA